MKTVREFTHLANRVSAGGGCLAAETAITRSGWVKFRECAELLYGRRFRLRPKGVVDRSYVRPAILHGSEAWFLNESDFGILYKTKTSMVRAMYGVQIKDRKRSTYLTIMLGLCESMNELTMTNSVRWHGHVLRRDNGHVLRGALD